MPSKLTLRMLLAAATLAALQLSASGAPLEDALTDGPAGVEASGEEEQQEGEETRHLPGSLNVFDTWEQVIDMTDCHESEFEKEFQGNVNYNSLDKHPSFPDSCPRSNFTKVACLQRLAQGLLTYMVLLKYAEKEYPTCSMVTKIRASVPQLVTLFKIKMGKSEQVKELTSNQEEKLLKELDDPDFFKRKIRAHSILSSLRFFLIDSKRSFRKWEKPKNPTARINTNCSCQL